MKVFGSLFPTQRFYYGLLALSALFVSGFFFSFMFPVTQALFYVFLVLVGLDILLLFFGGRKLEAHRLSPEKMSLADENTFSIELQNNYSLKIKTEVVDEIPMQFQERDFCIRATLKPGEHKKLNYQLLPVKRGEYFFGALRVFVRLPLGIFSRRFSFKEEKMLPVYPSFLQMRKYEL